MSAEVIDFGNRTSATPPARSPLVAKAERLEQLSPGLADVIEGLIDNMLEELEKKGGA